MLIRTKQIRRKIDEHYADLTKKINAQHPDGKQSIALEFIEQQRLADLITVNKLEEILERTGIQRTGNNEINIDSALQDRLSKLGI